MSKRSKTQFFSNNEFAHLQLWGIDMLFNDLKNYQALIENFLLQEKQKLEEEFEKTDFELESKKAGDNHREYYNHLIDSYSERHHEIAGLFPHHFRCFFLTQAISVIESELKKVCNYHGKYKKQKFTVDDLKGSDDLEKCKDYLSHVADIDFKDLANEWQFIKNCKALRNKIVHQDGKVKIEHKALVQFIDQHPSISYEEQLNSHFVSFTIDDNTLAVDLIKNSINFFQKLIDKLQSDSLLYT